MTGTAKWTPAVSPTKKQKSNVHATGKFSGCTGTKGVTSGTFTFDSKGTTAENCNGLITSKAATTAKSSIKWNNTKTSVSAKVTLKPSPTPYESVTAKVSSGTLFVGKTVKVITLFTPVGGGCITPGKSLSSASLSIKKGTKFTIG